MKKNSIHRIFLALSFFASLSAMANFDQAERDAIDKLTGVKGTYIASEDVYKVNVPRKGNISVDQIVKMPPFMGLTSWAGFKHNGKDLVLMGDLVLFEDEVNPVMSALLDKVAKVTALHNHFFYANPNVYFMHIGGEGALDTLANAVGLALSKVEEIRKNPIPSKNFGGTPMKSTNISLKPIKAILPEATDKDGMVKAVIGRKVDMKCGCGEVGKEMGVNTWAAFYGSDDDAVVDGDFAVREEELQDVLKVLRSHDVNIVAIHHHMTEEKPRMLFLHYWGRSAGDKNSKGTEKLANAVKEALAKAHD